MTSPKGDTTTDFLVQVARKRGRLGKGGVPNLVSAAMTVLVDWRDGRVHGWCEPPPILTVSGNSDGGDVAGEDEEVSGDRKEIVKEWAEEFKIEGLWGDTGADRNGNGDGDGVDSMELV